MTITIDTHADDNNFATRQKNDTDIVGDLSRFSRELSTHERDRHHTYLKQIISR